MQKFKFERVGGIEPRSIDIRLISASKRDLAKMVQEGTFRDDLYYRMKVLSLILPSLRERKQDISLLVEHFLKRHSSQPIDITDEALETLMVYDWPGNVRQLENTIRRMIATSNNAKTLEVHHIPQTMRYGQVMKIMQSAPENIPFEQLMRQTERQLILMALEQSNWNKTRASEILELNRTTLISKMKRLDIPFDKP